MPFLQTFTLPDLILSVVDILLVSYILYKLFSLIKGTRAVPLISGITLLIFANLLAKPLGLHTLAFILDKAFIAGAVAIPIIFQPELRRALEHLGRNVVRAPSRFLPQKLTAELGEEDINYIIGELVKSSNEFARTRTGSLMVIERETGLQEYMEGGVRMDAQLTWQLLVNTFTPNTPLHDGAVIIRGNRIAAAACRLPLAEASDLSSDLGFRHRAAIGLTEQTDAICVVTSEETGVISLAHAGTIRRGLDGKALREALRSLLKPKNSHSRPFWNWGTA
jgi:diadenylate cyclase